MNLRPLPNAIMFADVSGSSALYKDLGNPGAHAMIEECLRLGSEIVRRGRGTVVKTIGDELMACFASALDCCEAAIALQLETADMAGELRMRIGAAWGDAIHENDDVFGEVVNDAAAVVDIARAGEIITTEPLYRELPEQARSHLLAFDRVRLKGSRRSSLIYRVLWERATAVQSNVTMCLRSSYQSETLMDQAGVELRIEHAGRTYHVDGARLPFVIGREAGKASLVIDSTRVSREHCHVLFNRGKFVLVDNSTNGTWVQFEGESPVYLRREELPLWGKGTIYPGVPPEQETGERLSFHCLV